MSWKHAIHVLPLALLAPAAPAQESLWEPGLLSTWEGADRGDAGWLEEWERPWGSAFGGRWIDPLPDAEVEGVRERHEREPRRPSPVRDSLFAKVQRRLGTLGYEVGDVDASWGRESAAALRRFQRARGLEPSGRLGRATLEALWPRERARRARTGERRPEERGRDAARPLHGAGDVRRLQLALEQRGFEVGPADGVWTPRTTAAVRDVQRVSGLPITGSLTPALFRELGIRPSTVGTPAAEADLGAGWRGTLGDTYGYGDPGHGYTSGTFWPAGDWDDFVREGGRQVGGAAGERRFRGAAGGRRSGGAVGSRSFGGAAGGSR